MDLPPSLIVVWWSALGLVVGSFLNVAIHRLPLEEETVSHPRRSRCPKCRHELTWKENIPVFSWLFLGGRCRWCRAPISWRYPFVELLTAAVWGTVAWMTPNAWDLVLVRNVVLAGLIVATFVDFDYFEIPDEVSIGGMILAPVASLLVPALHEHTLIARELSSGEGVDRFGALAGSLAGLAVGGGSLVLLGWIGRLLYRREAMGFGDVKLLAAGGGFVGPGGALAALLLGSLVASVVGLANMMRFWVLCLARARARGVPKSMGKAVRVARIAGRYIPFGPYLGLGIGIVLLGWNDVLRLLRELVFWPS